MKVEVLMVAGLSFWLLVYELVSIPVDPNHNIKLFRLHVCICKNFESYFISKYNF